MSGEAHGAGWYVVDATTGQPVGPYDAKALQGLLANQHITLDTPLWCEGWSEWLPLRGVGELQPVVKVAEEVARAARKSAAAGKDELDVFQEEITALEVAAASEPGEEGGVQPGTPEELEFEDDDGTSYVWDRALHKYMPKELTGGTGGAGAEAAYDPELMTFQGGDEVIPTLAAVRAAEAGVGAAAGQAGARKRKAGEGEGGGGPGAAGANQPAAQPGGAEAAPDASATTTAAAGQKLGKKQKGKGAKPPAEPSQPPQWFELKNNTSIYVSGLPLDVSVEEVSTVFSKFGLIKEQLNKQPRIKLYRDRASGELKGDALVTFLREPSVALAVQLMDGTPFRPGMTRTMTVQPAKFEQKGEAYVPKAKPSKKEKKVLAAQQERLLSWGGCDDKLLAEQSTVIIKHMFSPEELAAELGAAEALEKEVLEEAVRLGPVEKVRVFKQHPDGVVSVRFKTADGTQACLAKMNGRFFDGRRLVAEMWDGITNYASVKVSRGRRGSRHPCSRRHCPKSM
ncbi:hypothetical protein V8C86DRAFT_1109068 [Haematococcus lacustris]